MLQSTDDDRRHIRRMALYTENLRAGPPPVARLRDLDARRLQPLVGLGDVGRAPRQAPELVRRVRHALPEIMRDLDHQVAAAEEQQPRAPLGIASVEPKIE